MAKNSNRKLTRDESKVADEAVKFYFTIPWLEDEASGVRSLIPSGPLWKEWLQRLLDERKIPIENQPIVKDAISARTYKLWPRYRSCWTKKNNEDELIRRRTAELIAEQQKEALMRLPASDNRAWRREYCETIVAHSRRQFAVGQGGFHAGALRQLSEDDWLRGLARDEFDRADFLYVYDCGSEPRTYIDRESDQLIMRRRPRIIDILFLSHLDRDHICGTPRLLDLRKGLHADTIVMPYLDNVERIIAFARSAGTRAEPFDGRIDRFYRDMVVDPVATLRSFRPRQIILVRSDGDDPLPEGTPPAEPPQGRPDGMPWKVGDGGHSKGYRGQCWAVAGSDTLAIRGGSFTLFGDKLAPAWRLIPYVRRSDPGPIETFKEVAEVLLEWERGSFAARMEDISTRRAVITRHRAKLAGAYKRVFGDKNLTSLCLYSGPAEPARAGAIQIRPDLPPAAKVRVGWMGTGDAYLREQSAIDAFSSHYSEDLDFVSTFVLPHHGSIRNSDPDRLVSEADIWVASAEPIHTNWEHPASALRDAVESAGKIFHHIRRNPASALDEQMMVFWQR
jgi:glyoxylase-like metal-dependent hydrolase (beta-lactamase superfamily II)